MFSESVVQAWLAGGCLFCVVFFWFAMKRCAIFCMETVYREKYGPKRKCPCSTLPSNNCALTEHLNGQRLIAHDHLFGRTGILMPLTKTTGAAKYQHEKMFSQQQQQQRRRRRRRRRQRCWRQSYEWHGYWP